MSTSLLTQIFQYFLFFFFRLRNRFGPERGDTVYIAVVPVALHGGRSATARSTFGVGRRVIAVGSYGIASFAYELNAAFLEYARKNVKRIPEKVSARFGFKKGEGGARSFRHAPKEENLRISDEAHAICKSVAAKKLVLFILDGLNSIVDEIIVMAPKGKTDPDLKAKKDHFLTLKEKMHDEWLKFSVARVRFLRARHVAMCRCGSQLNTPFVPHSLLNCSFFVSFNQPRI